MRAIPLLILGCAALPATAAAQTWYEAVHFGVGAAAVSQSSRSEDGSETELEGVGLSARVGGHRGSFELRRDWMGGGGGEIVDRRATLTSLSLRLHWPISKSLDFVFVSTGGMNQGKSVQIGRGLARLAADAPEVSKDPGRGGMFALGLGLELKVGQLRIGLEGHGVVTNYENDDDPRGGTTQAGPLVRVTTTWMFR